MTGARSCTFPRVLISFAFVKKWCQVSIDTNDNFEDGSLPDVSDFLPTLTLCFVCQMVGALAKYD